MDGRGRAAGNIFVERLWRSVKYENDYLNGYRTIDEAFTGLANYFAFYNGQRYHQALRLQDARCRVSQWPGWRCVDRRQTRRRRGIAWVRRE